MTAHDPAACPAPVDDPARIVHVGLGDRSYDIRIGRGLLASLGTRLNALAPGSRVGIVADAQVWALYGNQIETSLANAEIDCATITVPPGEQSKCFAEVERISSLLIDAKLERGDVLLAVGGGVTGDLAGFCASILRRGIRFVQVPTSLLAQVDSSVGGKTGIDMPQGKNLIGCFHQPIEVIADTGLLDTLSEREFRAGYAEVAKYGLLGDATFFAQLEQNWRDIFSGGSMREDAVAKSCMAKADIVAQDEREGGVRALLNLGHTFGHAFEAATGYSSRLLHGEAIAIGMVLAFQVSADNDDVSADTVARVVRHFQDVGLPTKYSDIPGPMPDAAGLLDLMSQDKKVERGDLTLILVRDIGDAYVAKGVDTNALKTFLDRAVRS